MNQKGITLIALVVTIIVLLVLAGVTLSMTLGDDGVIAQAQKAKEANKNAANNENEAIQQGEGIIDSYTEGTLAYEIKNGTAKIGDYVNYTYKPGTYNATPEETGYTNSQAFDSNTSANEALAGWRILSAEGGVIRLIPDLPATVTADNGLILSGAIGYVNGPKTLNNICEALYSGEYGTARSIDEEDVNKATGWPTDDKKYQWYCPSTTKSSSRAYLAKNVIKTLGDIEEENSNLRIGGSRLTPDGSEIENVQANYYYYQMSANLGEGYESNVIWQMLSGNKVAESGGYPYSIPDRYGAAI